MSVESRQANGRTETQLRQRITELEARLAEVSRCLQDAENRASELLVAEARVKSLEHKLGVITTTRSWRMTKPMRSVMGRVRRQLGR